ncbi:MAG: amidohydrolase family protein [Pseudomonadota bacterium]
MKGLLAVGLLLVASACANQTLSNHADTIFRNGAVYTMVEAQPWAEAVAIRGVEIAAVGSNKDIVSLIGPNTNVVDLHGKMLLPGFHDAHIHSMMGGQMLTGCSLAEAATIQQTLDIIRGCAEESDQPWLVVDSLDLSLFGEDGPSRKLLDNIDSQRPIVVNGADGHTKWLSSAALAAANITADTMTPENGVIEREPDNSPSGTLRESATSLVTKMQPVPSDEKFRTMLLTAAKAMNAVGITSVLDAWVARSKDPWNGATHIDTVKQLADEGLLTIRLNGAMSYGYGDMFIADKGEAYEETLAKRSEFESERFRLRTVKIFADGVLEGETAALVDPYVGKNGSKGNLTFPADELRRIITELDGQGVQVFTHAIGDGAVRATLDAIENAKADNGSTDLRHHISHLQLIHPDDLPRFAQLDVVANFQALWAYPDEYITELNLPVLGQQRVDRMYPIASIKKTGAAIVGGSDWNVSSMNPLEAIETAMLRSDAINNGSNSTDNPRHSQVLNKNERVDLDTMLRAYTSVAAWSMHQDDISGSIEVGKRADLVVLDQNLFEIDPALISEAQVLMTLIDGETVFEQALNDD